MSEVVDHAWFPRYARLWDFSESIESQLRIKDSRERLAAFRESGFSVNPILAPEVDLAVLTEYDRGFAQLGEQIAETEDQPVVRDAYLPAIAYQRGRLAILRSAAEQDTEGFKAANSDVFPTPVSGHTQMCLDYFHQLINRQLSGAYSPAVREAAFRAHDTLPWPALGDPKFGIPKFGISETDFSKSQALHEGFFNKILEGVSIPEEISGHVALAAAQKALDNIGVGYRAVPQKEGISTMAAHHPERELKVPLNVAYDRQRFIGLLGHEGCIHIEERVRGETQPLQLLSTGLARYLSGSEGKGVMAEQVQYPTFTDFLRTERFRDIARRYLAIALASPGNVREAHDFKDVFAMINSVDYLLELMKQPDDPDAAAHQAENRTWELLAMRALRGWSGVGCGFLKDLVYLDGNLAQWKVVKEKPELFPYFNLGKYDAANPDHIGIMQTIGSIPTNL